MNTLHIFGDSYSTPRFCVEPDKSFWGLLSADLAVSKTINYSHSGFSFEQIIHLILNEEFDFKNDYFFIGIPPIVRLSLFIEEETLSEQPAEVFDKDFNSAKTQTPSTTGVMQFDFVDIFGDEKKFLSMIHHGWLEVKTCDQILLLHTYLSSKKAKFIIANLTIPFYYDQYWPAGKTVINRVNDLKECIVFRDTFYSINKDDGIRPVDRPGWPINYVGHHGPEGNANWYNKVIKPKIKELGWVHE